MNRLPIRLILSTKRSAMYHDVVSLECLDDFTLKLTLDDGKAGILDCKPFIAQGGVFSKLRDIAVFRRAKINRELGVVAWDDKIDIAPETAYSLATGSPLPAWMETDDCVTGSRDTKDQGSE